MKLILFTALSRPFSSDTGFQFGASTLIHADTCTFTYHCFCIIGANINTKKEASESYDCHKSGFDVTDPLKESQEPPGGSRTTLGQSMGIRAYRNQSSFSSVNA